MDVGLLPSGSGSRARRSLALGHHARHTLASPSATFAAHIHRTAYTLFSFAIMWVIHMKYPRAKSLSDD
jgi:hypothetical protein